MAKKRKPAAKKPERPKTFVEHTMESIKAELEENIKQLRWQIDHGGSYQNIHFFNTIRDIQAGYLRYAAHKDAARSLKIHLGEERV
jgi:predicted glycoside hydrolase/deacetylase ChbG (UPF0249 family)